MGDTLQAELMKKLQERQDEMIKISRHLHEHPEVSFHEKMTAQYIKNFYKGLDCQVKDCGDGYGIIVDIQGAHPGKRLALRADFDALPIQEDNDLPFKSQNPGVMHACGHDAHTAYMLVLAKCLIELKDQLHGSIRIIHQPAEEVSPGGALSMIKDGVLDGVDNVVGIHVMSTMPTGAVELHSGPTQTGRANFDLTFTGKGGHASMPQYSHDAIVAGSYFVTELQTVVSRRLNPFDVGSVTIGSFDGAGSYNAIQEKVKLKGDVRIMDEQNRDLIKKSIQKVIRGVDDAFDVHSQLDYDDNYPVLVNDKQLTTQIADWLTKAQLPQVTQIKDSSFVNASEDFAYYAEQVPSCFFYVGCQVDDGEVHPHHSPDFLLNEKAILICAEAMGTVVTNYLTNNKQN